MHELGAASECRALLLQASSMHPSEWIAVCRNSIGVIVVAARTSEHARKGGNAVARIVRLTEPLREQPVSEADAPANANPELIQGPTVLRDAQVLGAHNESRGQTWADGVNHAFPAGALSPLL